MSELLRFFVPAEALQQGDSVSLAGETLHHMQQVLRLRENTEVLLLDGLGTCCLVRLEQFRRDLAIAPILKRWQVAETALPLEIIQALPKGDKFDLVLQKGTELGVATFQPILTSRAIARTPLDRLNARLPRWERIVREATRQSQRNLLPEVRPVLPLVEAVAAASGSLKLALWEEGARPLAEVLPDAPPSCVSVLIGPEGGLSRDEVKLAMDKGFQPVHLGPRVLRTETAGLAVAPILQYLYGDWQAAPAEEFSKE